MYSISLTHMDYVESWLEAKEVWKMCISYEYKGKDIECAKQYFDIQPFGPQKDRFCVKQIKFNPDQPLNDNNLSNLLLECVPFQFMNIQNKEEDPKKGIQSLLNLLKSSLGVTPSVLSFGARCNQKTEKVAQYY